MAAFVFAYIGPETTMPLLSAIAGVCGAILMFGRTTFRFLLRKTRNLLSLSRPAESLASGDSAPETPSSRNVGRPESDSDS